MDRTDLTAHLVHLTATQRVAEAQAELDALILSDPEQAAQWYILARLLLHAAEPRQRQIRAGLAKSAASIPWEQAVAALDTVQRLERFLAQVRRSRPQAGLRQFLQQVRTYTAHGHK
ncbi:MAG: hypothetical protein HQL87_07365 [Magnetococcales bacterium]|nr:hypothetical protein [Magnetococcales bacterium]